MSQTESAPIQTEVLDGLALANEVRGELGESIAQLVAAGNRAPCLAVVLVGDDPASRSYIKGKQRACARIGMESLEHLLPEDTPEDALLELIAELNANDGVDGIYLFNSFTVRAVRKETPLFLLEEPNDAETIGR